MSIALAIVLGAWVILLAVFTLLGLVALSLTPQRQSTQATAQMVLFTAGCGLLAIALAYVAGVAWRWNDPPETVLNLQMRLNDPAPPYKGKI